MSRSRKRTGKAMIFSLPPSDTPFPGSGTSEAGPIPPQPARIVRPFPDAELPKDESSPGVPPERGAAPPGAAQSSDESCLRA